MLHTLSNLLAPAVAERLTLVFNHVLGSESVAMERLRPHAGRRLELQLAGWPSLLPAPPPLALLPLSRWSTTAFPVNCRSPCFKNA